MKIEKQAILVLLSVTIILILFYIGFGIFFPNVGVVQYTADTPDNTRVMYEGTILSTAITSVGGHCILTLSDDVTVFVEGGAENIFYQTGDRVKVIGVTSTYGGVREIVVDHAGSIQILDY